jgi:glucosamine 6-phosphate synthetase-like amidotransferase/phosphosugar isomerase protein
MAAFTTRVELHDAIRDNYEKLHSEMERRGFSRTITSDKNVTYDLPPAEYNYEGAVTRNDVLEKAKSAAAAVKPSYAVLVTESAGRTWHNLSERRKAVA